MTKKPLIKILVAIAAIMITFAALGVSTYAIWSQKTQDAVVFEMGIGSDNPSLKYQIFVPLDADGRRIGGSFGFADRVYTLSDPADAVRVTSLALVGWDGGIAVSRLIVPDTFNYNIDGEEQELPVTRIIADSSFRLNYFRGNTVINHIEIPQNVVYVAGGVFSSMPNLAILVYRGTGEIGVARDAFIDCPMLADPLLPESREIVEL